MVLRVADIVWSAGRSLRCGPTPQKEEVGYERRVACLHSFDMPRKRAQLPHAGG